MCIYPLRVSEVKLPMLSPNHPQQRNPLLLGSTPVDYLHDYHFTAQPTGVEESIAQVDSDRISREMPFVLR